MISLVFCTFVTLNYSYRIIKTSSRLVSCPGEPVLNHKMAHTRKNFERERIDVLIWQNEMQNVIIWHPKPV